MSRKALCVNKIENCINSKHLLKGVNEPKDLFLLYQFSLFPCSPSEEWPFQFHQGKISSEFLTVLHLPQFHLERGWNSPFFRTGSLVLVAFQRAVLQGLGSSSIIVMAQPFPDLEGIRYCFSSQCYRGITAYQGGIKSFSIFFNQRTAKQFKKTKVQLMKCRLNFCFQTNKK